MSIRLLLPGIPLLLLVFAQLIPFPALAQMPPPLASELLALPIEELLNASVVSASRLLTSIDKAPSVMTVVTAEQIKRQGLRTLNDVLQRTPGFVTVPNTPALLIANRGVIQDQNVNYLLLIDGHVQNNITVYGFFNQIMYPFLENVERIEIVRGPGSTLWGSDALSGIIHIITKDGSKEDNGLKKEGTFRIGVDHTQTENRKVLNLQYAKDFGQGRDLLFSYTGADSNGNTPEILGRDRNHVPVPPGGAMRTDPYHVYPYSYDMQLKSNLGGFTVLARQTEQLGYHGQTARPPLDINTLRTYQQSYVEVAYKNYFSNLFEIESRIFYDTIKLTDDQRQLSNFQNWIDERGWGFELLNRSDLGKLKLLAGMRSVRKNVEPGWQQRYGAAPTSFAHAGGTDVTNAFFGEGTYIQSDALRFILGARWDQNNLREDKSHILPRTAIVYTPGQNWMFKYMYNTGIMRPTLLYSFDERGAVSGGGAAGMNYGSHLSQLSRTHDFQIGYTTPTLKLTGTVYDSTIENFITFAFNPIPGTSDAIRYANMAPIHSKGIELEGVYKLNEQINVYGNFSRSHARFTGNELHTNYGVFLTSYRGNVMQTDGRFVGVPQTIYNLGVNIDFNESISLNTHIRGWSDGNVRWIDASSATTKLGPEHFLDFNLLCRNCPSKNLDLSFYGKNVLNNKANAPGLINHVYTTYGRVVGIYATLKF